SVERGEAAQKSDLGRIRMGVEVTHHDGWEVGLLLELACEGVQRRDLTLPNPAVIKLAVQVRGEHGQDSPGGLDQRSQSAAGLFPVVAGQRPYLAVSDRPAGNDQIAERVAFPVVG